MTDFTTSPTDDGGAITPPRALDADGDGRPDYSTVPTQILYPLRTIMRSIVQALVGAALAWLARQGVEVTDPELAAQLVELISAVVWVAGTALATWVMTRPAVADLLSRTLLAPTPAPRL